MKNTLYMHDFIAYSASIVGNILIIILVVILAISVLFLKHKFSMPLQKNSVDAAPNTSPLEIQCPHCSQVRFFKGQRGLNIHISRVHGDLAPGSTPPLRPSSNPTHSSLVNTPPISETLSKLKNSIPVIKRIPRSARFLVAQKLTKDLKTAINQNSQESWEHLLTFPYRILYVREDVQRGTSLTSRIKQNCANPHNVTDLSSSAFKQKLSLSQHVENKIGEGNIKGAARLLFSSDTLAPDTSDTLAALLSKHPNPDTNLVLPDPPSPTDRCLQVTSDEVLRAVCSFPNGSAGGLDGLSPQHLKDLLGHSCGEAGDGLLKELTFLVNLMLQGKVSQEVTSILYGANLCALIKRDGGIRPIAVGTTYRRLAAKCCCKAVSETLRDYFQPVQLGFGSKCGCEAAVHALRAFITRKEGEVLLKVDVRNAFNSVDRGALLTQVKEKTPEIFNFVWQCYSTRSKLLFKNNLLFSSVGCQQGDPLGPALFSLAIHPIINSLNSKFNAWYLDDGTLGGKEDEVFEDLRVLTEKFAQLGLTLNFSKCELFFLDNCVQKDAILSKFQTLAPDIKVVDQSSLVLLGSPIMDEAFPGYINERHENFSNYSERLLKINPHMAYTIIKFCLFVPKFTYILRCCPLWKYPNLLAKLDNLLKSTVSSIFNIELDDRQWTEASLPIRHGGIGIRQISKIALPAFISSTYSTQNLCSKIQKYNPNSLDSPFLPEAIDSWKAACPNTDLPTIRHSQRQWDEPLCVLVRDNLYETATSPTERARLLAGTKWESGVWLQALPSKNLGTLLTRDALRFAVSLRLGAACVVPHVCHCGAKVTRLGLHGLSCIKSAGRTSRHASLNDILRRALVTAGVPAVLEPSGLARDDGKRPDGMTLVPWKLGRPLVWDATCVDTLAPSHLSGTSSRAGAAANTAENLKRRKYAAIDSGCMFEPFGVETLGPWGPGAHAVYKELAKRVVEASGDQRAGGYLAQRIGIAIQRGNAASLMGTLPHGTDLEPVFYL